MKLVTVAFILESFVSGKRPAAQRAGFSLIQSLMPQQFKIEEPLWMAVIHVEACRVGRTKANILTISVL
jgi:hypothetical protein